MAKKKKEEKPDEELKDDAHLRGKDWKAVPEEQYIEATVVTSPKFAESIMTKAAEDDTTDPKRYARGAFLQLWPWSPRPLVEDIISMNARPVGKEWHTTMRVRTGHWFISDFILLHGDVEVTRIADTQIHMVCSRCGKKVVVDESSVTPAPPWFGIHRIAQGCFLEVSDELYGAPYLRDEDTEPRTEDRGDDDDSTSEPAGEDAGGESSKDDGGGSKKDK